MNLGRVGLAAGLPYAVDWLNSLGTPASYAVRVPRAESLPSASFRFRVATDSRFG